jgi:hypothetical protein
MVIMCSYLTLTQANLDHGHLYLRSCIGVFPRDAVGGTNKSQAAPRTVRVHFGASSVDTDIDGDKRLFRSRAWVVKFLRANGAAAGDRVLLEQLDPYSYRVSMVREVMCLSIQQPWADLILDGKKKVENRTWTWLQERNWKLAGSVPLAIHASKSTNVWWSCQNRDELAPGWHPGDGEVGAVLGMVDVVEICRAKDLPRRLKGHKFADNNPNNWCWVLDKPRRFDRPHRVTGNVFFSWRLSNKKLIK